MGLLSNKLSAKEMALICRQMATAYGAGIPVVRCLQMTAEQGGVSRGRRALLNMAVSIQEGATLAGAARNEASVFPDFFIEVLWAGEMGGRLDVLLRDLAEHYETMHRSTRAVFIAMLYPGFQLIAAWFLGTFALGLIRSISSMSDSPSGRFQFSDYLSAYIQFQTIALVLALIAAGVFIVLARAGLLYGVISLLKNGMWPASRVSQKFAMARFYRGMALLIHAGVDLQRCIERSAALTMNRAMEQDLLKAIPVISGGGTLVNAFAGSRYMSRVGKEMLAVGEESGNLDAMLQKAAEYSFEEAQTAVRAAAKILQVLVTLVVAGIVGYFVISFYANLYGSALQGL